LIITVIFLFHQYQSNTETSIVYSECHYHVSVHDGFKVPN